MFSTPPKHGRQRSTNGAFTCTGANRSSRPGCSTSSSNWRCPSKRSCISKLWTIWRLCGSTCKATGGSHISSGREQYPRSQEIAEACAFLGADGILVPSARHSGLEKPGDLLRTGHPDRDGYRSQSRPGRFLLVPGDGAFGRGQPVLRQRRQGASLGRPLARPAAALREVDTSAGAGPKSGIWERVFDSLTTDRDEYLMLDSTIGARISRGHRKRGGRDRRGVPEAASPATPSLGRSA